MYQFFDYDLRKELFLELFNSSYKDTTSPVFTKAKVDLLEFEEVINLFKHFNGIPYDIRCIDLVKIERHVAPYISPNNNGMILFPLEGCLEMEFYSFIPEEYENGRPILLPDIKKTDRFLKTIKETLIEKIEINTKPLVINGLVTHSYRPADKFIGLMLKIPVWCEWDKVMSRGIQL